MRICPFCESPAAPWPEYASEYIKGYPLCEHHMSPIVNIATVLEYNSAMVEANSIQSDIVDQVGELLDRLDQKYQDENQITDSRADEFIRRMLDSLPKPDGRGEPVNVYMDEAEADRLIALRIRSFAEDIDKGRGVHRCSGFKDGAPDSRCINRVFARGDICPDCDKKKRSKAIFYDSGKLGKIMEMMRNDHTQNHQNHDPIRQGGCVPFGQGASRAGRNDQAD